MLRRLMLVALFVFPAVSSASDAGQVDKYGYGNIHLNFGAGTTNEAWLENSNVTTINLGGNRQFTDNWLFNFDFAAQFFHPDTYTLRIDRLMVGSGYRYGLTQQLDIYGIYRLGMIKAKARENETDRTLLSDTEFIHEITIGTNYLLRERLIVNAEVAFNDSDIVDENKYIVGLIYQWHDVIGTGLYYKYRDTDYRGASPDYINEVGLHLKFLY